MLDFTIDDFISFINYYLDLHGLELGNEPPQATTYRKTEELLKIEYPHYELGEEEYPSWNMTLRNILEENTDCDGFICWMVLNEENDEEEIDRVLFVSYHKESDQLASYLSEKNLENFQGVLLEEVMINLVDNYGSEIVYH